MNEEPRVGMVIEDKWDGVYLLLERRDDVWAALVLCTQNDGLSAGMGGGGSVDELLVEWVLRNTVVIA